MCTSAGCASRSMATGELDIVRTVRAAGYTLDTEPIVTRPPSGTVHALKSPPCRVLAVAIGRLALKSTPAGRRRKSPRRRCPDQGRPRRMTGMRTCSTIPPADRPVVRRHRVAPICRSSAPITVEQQEVGNSLEISSRADAPFADDLGMLPRPAAEACDSSGIRHGPASAHDPEADGSAGSRHAPSPLKPISTTGTARSRGRPIPGNRIRLPGRGRWRTVRRRPARPHAEARRRLSKSGRRTARPEERAQDEQAGDHLHRRKGKPLATPA